MSGFQDPYGQHVLTVFQLMQGRTMIDMKRLSDAVPFLQSYTKGPMDMAVVYDDTSLSAVYAYLAPTCLVVVHHAQQCPNVIDRLLASGFVQLMMGIHEMWMRTSLSTTALSYSLPNHRGVPIDRILIEFLRHQRNGVYIEAGANDGIRQSNTKLLEDEYGWTGMLVEPSPGLFPQLTANRPKNTCVNAALVSSSFPGKTISGDFDGNLMSSVNGQRRQQHATVTVPAYTLSTLIDAKHLTLPIDLLSLDTEGYEVHILNGIDWKRHAPKWIFVELYKDQLAAATTLLESNGYDLIGNISNYNKTDHPGWDGTHNDYLFRLRIEG